MLVLGGVAVAQGRGGGPRGPLPHAGMQLKAGSAGIYVLQGNVLLKYATGSLEAAGSVKVADAPTLTPDAPRPPMGAPAGEMALWKDASGALTGAWG